MVIRATREDLAVELRTEWDEAGHPARTVLEVRPAIFIDARHHVDWFAADGGAPPPTGLALPDCGDEAIAVIVDAERVQIVLPAPVPDIDRALSLLEALVDVGRRLSGKIGGYR
jgi:hypothetical protein